MSDTEPLILGSTPRLSEKSGSQRFFNPLTKVVEGLRIPAWRTKGGQSLQPSATGKDIMDGIKGVDFGPGVSKKQAIKWSGIQGFLLAEPKAKFTKEEVLAFIAQNGPRLEEVVAKNAVGKDYVKQSLPDGIPDILITVGNLGRLETRERSILAKIDWINRTRNPWETVAETLSQDALGKLVRGLVVTERELAWAGGSAAAAIWVYRVYETRFDQLSIVSLANWVLKHRGRNNYLPFGGQTAAKSYEEWVREQESKNQRSSAHWESVSTLKEEKKRREVNRIKEHKERIIEGKRRATLVREFNERLASLNEIERLEFIANTEMPLEAVSVALLQGADGEVLALDSKTSKILLQKIDKRNRGPWGRIRRVLN